MHTAKEEVIQLLKDLPDNSTLEEIQYHLYVRQKIQRGIKDVEEGRTYTQEMAERLAGYEHLVLLCGRYEGIDERIRTNFVDEEISIGDYILTGGELAAMVLIDSITRLLPGILGCEDSAENDTFSRGLLKNPQYTRPQNFEGYGVPDILLSGDHAAITEWRLLASVRQTLEKRPELLARAHFSEEDRKILKKHNLLDAIAIYSE